MSLIISMKINLIRIFIQKLLFIFLGIVLGVIWYKYDFQPRPFIRKLYKGDYEKLSNSNLKINNWDEAKLTFSKYKVGVPLFLDRPYSDTFGDDRLEKFYLIQINRHEKRNISIKVESPITIYRFVTGSNSGLKHKYTKTNIKVKVAGRSTNHINVVKKTFKPGNLILSPGGPISSSPILFSLESKKNLSNIIINLTN